jgi:hypothetical protein
MLALCGPVSKRLERRENLPTLQVIDQLGPRDCKSAIQRPAENLTILSSALSQRRPGECEGDRDESS